MKKGGKTKTVVREVEEVRSLPNQRSCFKDRDSKIVGNTPLSPGSETRDPKPDRTDTEP